MKKYFFVEKLLLVLNFSMLLTYRVNFINSIVSSVLWGTISVIMMSLLAYNSTSIYGWKHDELLLLVGIYNIIISFFHLLFSRNFQRFSQIIHYGELDSLLIKPIDTQFLMSFWIINYTSFVRLILGVLFCIFIVMKLHIIITMQQIALFLFILIMSMVFLYSLWFLIMTLTIWFTRLSNLVDLLYEINGAARFPSEMFKEIGGFVFLFFVPLSLIMNTPTKTILQKSTLSEIIILSVVSCLLFFLSRKFWKFALRNYSSASS